MSPPTIVLSREQVDIPRACPEIELVQFECAMFEGEKTYTCVPVTRRFRVCDTALGRQRFEVTDGPMSSDVRELTREMLSLTRD